MDSVISEWIFSSFGNKGGVNFVVNVSKGSLSVLGTTAPGNDTAPGVFSAVLNWSLFLGRKSSPDTDVLGIEVVGILISSSQVVTSSCKTGLKVEKTEIKLHNNLLNSIV